MRAAYPGDVGVAIFHEAEPVNDFETVTIAIY